MEERPGDVPAYIREFIDGLRARYQNAYRLRWKGTKIPRGAAIDGKEISWTQHGIVYGGPQNETLGYYKRTEEFSGDGRDEHEMLIATDGTLTPGHGHSVEQIRDFALNAQ